LNDAVGQRLHHLVMLYFFGNIRQQHSAQKFMRQVKPQKKQAFIA
jgi:hypothetical protein